MIELEDKDKENTIVKEMLEDKENTAKEEKIENKDAKKSASKENVEMKVSKNDKTALDSKEKARWYDLGFLQSKIIKNIFCCLSERHKIGKKIFPQLISFNHHHIRPILLYLDLPGVYDDLQ